MVVRSADPSVDSPIVVEDHAVETGRYASEELSDMISVPDELLFLARKSKFDSFCVHPVGLPTRACR